MAVVPGPGSRVCECPAEENWSVPSGHHIAAHWTPEPGLEVPGGEGSSRFWNTYRLWIMLDCLLHPGLHSLGHCLLSVSSHFLGGLKANDFNFVSPSQIFLLHSRVTYLTVSWVYLHLNYKFKCV